MQIVFENDYITIKVSKYDVANVWARYGKVRVYLNRAGGKRTDHIELTRLAQGHTDADIDFPDSRFVLNGEHVPNVGWRWFEITDRYYDDERVRVEVKESVPEPEGVFEVEYAPEVGIGFEGGFSYDYTPDGGVKIIRVWDTEGKDLRVSGDVYRQICRYAQDCLKSWQAIGDQVAYEAANNL